MRFDYDAQQRLLLGTARDLFAAHTPLACVRAWYDQRHFERGAWQAIAAQGWTAALLSSMAFPPNACHVLTAGSSVSFRSAHRLIPGHQAQT
ncbi:MAG: hypothetical protein JO352_14325, partial [Chloroflexi bacterium]|nr:hypothetical protein [Chloroflexota bacterium]